MHLDLSKYSGYYWNYERGSYYAYDVVYLVRPEWYIPNKKIKYRRVEMTERTADVVAGGKILRKGDIMTTQKCSPHFLQMVEYLKNNFKLPIDN